ncbi:transposase family protein [Pseudonocardia sp. ICBG601]|uniref:transposase family protein n=1 Tax=Pseudonocardia sp. ICBG601 TaxID=2846759 RepID=UPI001CF715A4|nr:transposase family protein [Pseudonocardia sp. ICBG601]
MSVSGRCASVLTSVTCLTSSCAIGVGTCWISDPTPGSRHDLHCLDQSGALDHLATYPPIGDKGYIGRGMLTPFKKQPGRELLDWQKTFNKSLNRTRATIERVIAHIKTWKVLHTDYRRPYATFKTTISAVIGLIFYTLT